MKYSAADNDHRRVAPTNPEIALDEVHRIVPLGLTLGEARAWYTNHVLIPGLRKAAVSAAASLLILIAAFSELGELLDATLPTHMVLQHLLFIAAGFLSASACACAIGVTSPLMRPSKIRSLLQGGIADPRLSVLIFIFAALLISYWYLPTQFDLAATNATAHAVMHAALVFAGGLVFAGSRSLSSTVRSIAPIVAGKALGLYGMFLLLTPVNVYRAYPAYEQAYAGVCLLMVMVMFDLTIMPLWLYNYFVRGSPSTEHRSLTA